MPWKVALVDERARFVTRLMDGERMTDLCKEYGIARKTGYKFLERYNLHGMEGLNNQSRRPIHLARKTSDEVERLVINLKGVYPTWGPKKLRARLVHPCLLIVLDPDEFRSSQITEFPVSGIDPPRYFWMWSFMIQFQE
jgi:hypothetical protein